VVVGDFNIAHRDIDVHSRWKIAEIYTVEEREWIDGFLNKYVDLYRHFHPNETDVFSVWNQKTEARIHNEGLRLVFFSSLNSKHFASLCVQPFFSLHLEHHFISERCQKLNSDVC
jgi:exodeoxyribonuclease-3